MKKTFTLIFALVLISGLTFAQDNAKPEKVPGAPYVKSDYPDASRQGGDDFASAVEITSLPTFTSGLTTGMTNDYSANCGCCGGSTTAPDVVYKITPANDGFLDVYVCAFYDSYVYVHEDTYPNQIACNDDDEICPPNQGYSGLSSAISAVPVFAGHTYYIVVDGFASSNGSYDVTINGDFTPIGTQTPISNWAIMLGVLLIASAVFFRYRRIA